MGSSPSRIRGTASADRPHSHFATFTIVQGRRICLGRDLTARDDKRWRTVHQCLPPEAPLFHRNLPHTTVTVGVSTTRVPHVHWTPHEHLMREIRFKFRVWSNPNKRTGFNGKMWHWEYFDSTPMGDINTTQYIWMQFTGLHDKNGKAIYQGDIVRYGDENARLWEKSIGMRRLRALRFMRKGSLSAKATLDSPSSDQAIRPKSSVTSTRTRS